MNKEIGRLDQIIRDIRRNGSRQKEIQQRVALLAEAAESLLAESAVLESDNGRLAGDVSRLVEKIPPESGADLAPLKEAALLSATESADRAARIRTAASETARIAKLSAREGFGTARTLRRLTVLCLVASFALGGIEAMRDYIHDIRDREALVSYVASVGSSAPASGMPSKADSSLAPYAEELAGLMNAIEKAPSPVSLSKPDGETMPAEQYAEAVSRPEYRAIEMMSFMPVLDGELFRRTMIACGLPCPDGTGTDALLLFLESFGDANLPGSWKSRGIGSLSPETAESIHSRILIGDGKPAYARLSLDSTLLMARYCYDSEGMIDPDVKQILSKAILKRLKNSQFQFEASLASPRDFALLMQAGSALARREGWREPRLTADAARLMTAGLPEDGEHRLLSQAQ